MHWSAALLNRIRQLHRQVAGFIARTPIGADKTCSLCSSRVRAFLPYRDGWAGVPPLLRELDIVGSDVENFSCPVCDSHDRERHLYLYLKASGLMERLSSLRILHFAPERRLSQRIAGLKPVEYVKADLYPIDDSIIRVDLLDIQFPDSRFNLVIANHVLEHVLDDRRAVREIARVLAPGGHAILQTPFARGLRHCFEDEGITSDSARLQAYGQEDHVRLFGADIFDRFAQNGFQSRVQDHHQLLPQVDSRLAGVNPLEPFFLFQKAAAAGSGERQSRA
jgi:SAM-dependent methyltransferase